MPNFTCLKNETDEIIYQPVNNFTAVELGYEQSDAISNVLTKINEPEHTKTYLELFNQIWNDAEKLKDVTESLSDHIASIYEENSPEQIYFLILYNIFNEFLDEISEDVLPNDKTGYEDSLIWKKLFNFQQDAATNYK